MKVVGLIIVWCLAAAGAAADATKSAVFERAEQAMWWGDFEALQRLHAEVLAKKERNDSGETRLGEFRNGMHNAMKGGKDVPDAFHVQIENLTASWTRDHPTSALAHYAHVRAIVDRAWSYRGTGYAKSVPPQAWADFEKHIRRATDHIVEHQRVALTDSSVHKTLIALGRAQGWNADRLWSIAQEGLKVDPDDDGLYFEVLFSVLPKWGGSAVMVDRLIERAVEHVGPERGPELYAMLYADAADDEFGHRLFEDSGAQWPRIKAGMDVLVRKYPSPRQFNLYAYLACLAKDKPVFLDLLERVGSKPELKQWGDNPVRTFETCRRWGSEQ